MNWKNIIQEIETAEPEIPVVSDIENGRYAVRYGYQYRKVAQKLCDQKGHSINFRLPEIEEILYWLANLILSGVAYDVIKKGWQLLVKKIKGYYNNLSEESKTVFSSEEKFHEFYEYIREYDDGLIHIKETERSYIEEEIYADIMGDLAKEYVNERNGISSIDDFIEQTFKTREKARKKMNEMLKRK